MTPVFADSFYFIALTNPRDAAHERAIAWTRTSANRLLTTSWVVTEFANYMCDPINRQVFNRMLHDLRGRSDVEIVPPEVDLWNEGLARFEARPDKAWSLTDCISFIVMERAGVSEALTGDHHFEQAGFVALLK